MKNMTKMTIEIPEAEYKRVKISAINLGISIKDYVLDALHLKEEIMIRDDGVVRRLKPATIKAMRDAEEGKNIKKFKNIDAALDFLHKNTTTKKTTKNERNNLHK